MSVNLTLARKTDPAGVWVSLGRVAGIVVLPQLPFWVACTGFSLNRPLFNLDVVLAALVACLFRRLGLTLLVVAWAVEVARIASLNYHFVSPLDFAATAQFADLVVFRQLLSWKLLVAAIGAVVCLLGLRRLVGRGAVPGLVAAVALLQILDMLNGSSQLLGLGADRFRVAANIAGSPTWNIAQTERKAVALARLPMSRYESPRVFGTITDWHRAHPTGSVLLILVESMGKPAAPEIDDWLGRRLATPMVAERWTLTRASDEFHGPTTSGELRVLCGLRGSYTDLKPVEEAGCLPRQWQAEGLQAHGLHGFHLQMFDRHRWWPRIGLSPWKFEFTAEDGRNFGCNGAFPGVCDDVVLDTAIRLADRPSQFVYVLTLDTHLPLQPGRQVPPELKALCARARTGDVACQMVAELGAVLEHVAAKLAQVAHPPLVVLVGDHSPPFLANESRQAFDAAAVPLYTLIPKTASSRVE